ncbi:MULTISPECIES: extracellular solute-binding protein [Roseovarius]|uniref:Fe(3+) ABC transporter substrate-binding protein n=1 Tax=Roseovarius nubinhibens TaxID=314263 RepID=A0A348WI83_9RHOB|nr:extracellular solute-binding protein [Roseovarius sp.]MAZ22308.1 Fe(3+) ABC transporter substrate-binding protein [Roseovarius sp.]HAR54245.1 Fe(3+) ABC transporter substrate-binding protein [Roseovarius nubinhibens]
MNCLTFARRASAAVALAALGTTAMADEVNVYSSRHYDSDDALYAKFTEQTGITVNRIEGEADELIARLSAEGDNSPADVFITVDIGRMGRAEEAGVLQAVESDVIANAVPKHLRDPENMWFGVSQRARIIFYAKDRVENPPRTYEELADPSLEGQICIRSSKNIYNQSLLASLIEANGEEAAKDWAAGIVANMARDPEGGDTDQLRGLVSGECDIAVANHYYFLRGYDKDVEGLTSGIDGIGWVWPNQSDRGAHLNLAAAAMTKSAPNAEAAKTFLEFLTSEFAQQHFASQNNEYPAVPGVGLDEDTARLGFFIPDTATNTASFGDNAAKAQAIFNEVNWK